MRNTDSRTTLEEWLAGLTTVGLLIVGFWQAMASLSHDDIRDVPSSVEAIRSGEATDQFSKHLDRHLPLREQLIATANVGRYVLTRGAGDQVRLGSNDWLFSVEELQFFPQAQSNTASRLDLAAQVAHQLAQQQVKLLVVLVPDKARVHADQLSDGKYPAWNRERYTQILSGLQSRNIPVVDLLAVLQSGSRASPVYYRTDTHWNQAGALLASQAIARQARTSQQPEWPVTGFISEAQATESERVGDLLNMMGLAHVNNWFRPDPDQEAAVTTRKQSEVVAAGGAAGGLFGDVSVPVVLAGTSYSMRANFHGYLQAALEAEVLNVAKDGGGFMQAIQAYMNDDAFKTAPPKLLIWEIPERMFPQPLSAQEQALASALSVSNKQ